jgi:hypothetical protein
MLSATSLLLRAELSSQSKVLQYFGGGYEIATFIRDKFAKEGDIPFMFWIATPTDGQAALSGPWLVLKQDYVDDFLLLHVLRIRPGNVGTDPPDDRRGQACDFTIRHHCRCGAREQGFLAGNGSNIHVPCSPGALAEGHRRVQSNRLQRVKRAQKH